MGANLSQDDFVADINVTPFVDVMLVLLIIFMVTAPMMTEGLDVDLPKVQESETLAMDNDHLIITVKDNGEVFLDEHLTTFADLTHVLQTRLAGRQVFLKADMNAAYGTVMNVMGRIRAAGIENIGMVTVSGSVPEQGE